MSANPDFYNAVGAWFLGPRGENAHTLSSFFSLILRHQTNSRIDYFPDDAPAITSRMQSTDIFKENINTLENYINQMAPELGKFSVPFWNPRYNGHMVMDTSMPGIVGYLMGMMFNSNNVAAEASPLTTSIEIIVGQELCKLVGFSTGNVDINPHGWGHITCGGSVANLESMWAARNLKFYPFSLRMAMKKELAFIADTFKVPLCSEDTATKLLNDFDTWELSNITPFNVLDIPTRLSAEYDITPSFLERTLRPYLIQTIGKQSIEAEFNIKPMAYFASATMHYSWPKAAAVTGIGSDNIIAVDVDNSARMYVNSPAGDSLIKSLEYHLDLCLKDKRAVYAVVAIIGSTEHGACDPLKPIIKLREEYCKKGLSFVLHADGAWGTYFLSCIDDDERKRIRSPPPPLGRAPMFPRPPVDSFVPTLPLKPETTESLCYLADCDSVTVDPHKSGYVQYPAGGLLYRDQRMRFLVTWTSPIVYRNEPENIGVYGIEGSKPGAAPMAVWMSHSVIGLGPNGYGQLLGEALFGGVKMYAHLATMSTQPDDFIVVPLNLLPAEQDGGDVEKQKTYIRDTILKLNNRELRGDKTAWTLVKKMGSDLSINAFAVNFLLADRTVNTDVVEANNLGQRIFKRLSIVDAKPASTPPPPPLILTSTSLSQTTYKGCLEKFKERLSLVGPQDLYTLVNVVMSPWPTVDDFTNDIVDALRKVIEEEVKISQFRNTLTNDFHGFVMQGTADNVYLTHIPMYNMENHRMQLVITGTISTQDAKDKYTAARQLDPKQLFTLRNAEETTLEKILAAGEFDAAIDKGIPPSPSTPPVASDFKLKDIKILVQRHLQSKNLDRYPIDTMPFALYGTSSEQHIDHILTAFPNTQLCAELVKITGFAHDPTKNPLVYAHLPRSESSMQPLPSNKDIESNPKFFFRRGMSFSGVTISKNLDGTGDPTKTDGTGDPVKKCTLEIPETKNIFIDTDMVNMDPVPEKTVEGTAAGLEGAAVRLMGSHLHQVTMDLRKDESLVPVQGFFELVVRAPAH
ncbi:hypothetical protein FRB93_011132 [Tulasnella sp. JGI-2019a]|nr:hypothetical protein FRB93_011132 [Tulasnella sp. JGI-2019a]